MAAPLTIQVVADRLTNFPLDRYLYIGSIMRGVSLAAGSYVIVEILRNPIKYWRHIPLWVGALLATLVTLTSWGRGVLLTNSRANSLDVFLPLLMGIVEFALFAILTPQKDERPEMDERPEKGQPDDEFKLISLWFLILGIHSFMAFFLVYNRILQTDVAKDFEVGLRPLAKELMQWMNADRLGSITCAVVFSLAGWLVKLLSRPLQGNSPILLWPARLLFIVLLFAPIFYMDKRCSKQSTNDSKSMTSYQLRGRAHRLAQLIALPQNQ